MGLSASQARLLTLTARLSDLELQAQQISNSKIRLSMESSRISEDYADALDKTNLSILTGTDSDGNKTYEDLTYDNLTGVNSPLLTQYCLSDNNGNILVTQDIANKFEKSDNVTDFLVSVGEGTTTTYAKGVTATQYQNAKNAVTSTYANYVAAHNATLNALSALDAYGYSHVKGYYGGGKWQYGSSTTTTTVSTKQTPETEVQARGEGIWGDPHVDYIDSSGKEKKFEHHGTVGATYKLFTGDNFQVYGNYRAADDDDDAAYIGTATIKSGNNTITYDRKGNATLNGQTVSKGASGTLSDGSKYSYSDKRTLTLTASDGTGTITLTTDDDHDGVNVDPSGSFSNLGGILGDAVAGKLDGVTADNKLSAAESTQYLITDINADAAKYTYNDITTTITVTTTGNSYSSETTPGAIVFLNSGNASEYNALLNTYKTALGVEAAAKAAYDSAVAYLASLGDVVVSETPNSDYYKNLYNRMCDGYVTMDNEADTINSPAWIQQQMQSGNLILEKCIGSYAASTTSGSTGTRAVGTWQTTEWSSDTNIDKSSDDDAAAKAEAVYNSEMDKIEVKDKKFDLKLKNIDTEHNAVQTEIDSVQKVIDKNIERTFKMFQA